MNNQRLHATLLILSGALLSACHPASNLTGTDPNAPKDLTTLHYTIAEAPEWSSLFKRSSGWFGGDGIFAIPANGEDNAPASDTSVNTLIFSDSMIGEIEDGQLKDSGTMVHNTVGVLHGARPVPDSIRFHWDTDSTGKMAPLFVPHTATSKGGDYYWLGDGFMNTENKNTYIFGFRMHTMDPANDWSFRQMAADLIILPPGDTAPFRRQRQVETPFLFSDSSEAGIGSLGAGIFVNTKAARAPHPDGYVYVYGTRGKEKNLVVARVRPAQFEEFSKWRFWDGQHWAADISRIANVTQHVSNELSLSPLKDGRYILVFQTDGSSADVAMRIAASPVGPFGPITKLFDCNEGRENKNYITYNAKAHPTLSKENELLITYNVNAFSFWKEIKANPFLYRPRFIKMKFE